MSDDAELLRRFTTEKSDDAFRELVRSRLDFVYGAALRQVGGNVHYAQEVAQNVFIDLARKARVLAARPSLSGWLYTSTRFAAAKVWRSRARRLNHEQEAQAMNEIFSAGSAVEPKWEELRPVLDEAMHELNEKDREAILLRFFEGHSLGEVGAKIGLAENSARMRVERALEKLRERLARRGITSTAAALGGVLAAQPAASAPAGMAVTMAGTALAGAAVAGAGGATLLEALKLLKASKLMFGALSLAATFGVGAYFGAHSPAGRERSETERRLNGENQRLKAQLAATAATPVRAAQPTTAPTEDELRAKAHLAGLEFLADVQRRGFLHAGLMVVNNLTEKLTPGFAEVFALTGAERESLQQILDRARLRLAEMERANATVSRNEKEEIVIKMKPFPKEGGAVYDELNKGFAETLGPARNAAYQVLGANQVESLLGGFGTQDVTWVVSRNALTGDYIMSHSWKRPEGSIKGMFAQHQTSNSQFRTRGELVKHLGGVAPLLPADF